MGKHRKGLLATGLAAMTALTGALLPGTARAGQPSVMNDDGAYVRVLGNPADGTLKFQFGWSASTPASAAAGYWVGVYDVTHSHYVWSGDTGPVDLPDEYFRNARPTAELPNGDYKIVYFVRGTYGPATNISEIEFPFSVTGSGM